MSKKSQENWNDLREEMLKLTNARNKKQALSLPPLYLSGNATTGNIINTSSGQVTSGGGLNFYPPSFAQSYNPLFETITEVGESKDFVVFWGFNGLLKQKYSVIKDMSGTEVNARLAFIGDKVPWCIRYVIPFNDLISMFKDTPNAVTEIDFNDALNIIRAGIDENKVDDFEDAEVDEFDDNCLVTCKPGSHDCGKH